MVWHKAYMCVGMCICRCAFVSTSDLQCADSGSARGSLRSSTMTGSTSAMSHTHTHTHNTVVRSRSELVTDC